jgi:hypothetical protein
LAVLVVYLLGWFIVMIHGLIQAMRKSLAVYFFEVVSYIPETEFVNVKEPRNQFRQAGNRFLGFLKG